MHYFVCDGTCIRQVPIDIIYALREVHEQRSKSKPFVFLQNICVPECKSRLSSVACSQSTCNTVSSLKSFLDLLLRYSFEVVFSVKTKEITES